MADVTPEVVKTKYVEITAEIKEKLLTLADGIFTDSSVDRIAKEDEFIDLKEGDVIKGSIPRSYQDVHAQFKSFPSKYIFEGIEEGLSPEEISDNIYNWMKFGKTPKEVYETQTMNHLYTGVPMRSYAEGPDETSDQENMLRFICGKVLIELMELVDVSSAP